MNGGLLKLYHSMPPFVRSAAASARGYGLRRLRYGAETERLVEQAIEREAWSAERWARWREQRLAFLLHRAATKVPYYRAQWEERRRRGDRASWEVLANWPVLTKDEVRSNGRALVAQDCDVSRMACDHTSGTSGKPLTLWLSRTTVRAWYALFEARCRRWYGISRNDRWAIFGGQLVASASQSRPPFWVWNAGLNQLYCSVYHLSPRTAGAYVEALRRYRVKYVVGYPSALDALAEASAARELGLAAAITNAEPVLPGQRERIEAAFGCPVRETYGMSEIVAAASECENGAMHTWPEAGLLETIDGELISTGLMNPDMPLIRYRTGDRVELGAEESDCACGRRLPVLAKIEGRSDDVLYTADGRRIGRLDPVFKASLPIQEAQIVQEALDRVRVLYVPDAGWSAAAGRELRRLIRDRMGDVAVELEAVERVPRGANGKFRAVVCKLKAEEIAHATR